MYSTISANPTNSKYTFTNFKYFSADGINMPSVYSTLSSKTGFLIYAKKDTREKSFINLLICFFDNV